MTPEIFDSMYIILVSCSSTNYIITCVTDHTGIEPRVAGSGVQCLNHWAIKVPEPLSRLCLAVSLYYPPPPPLFFFKSEPPGLGHFQPRWGASTLRQTRVTAATSVMDRAGIEPRAAGSRVQCLNHWAIKEPE